MQKSITNERAFEEAIENSLIERGGYSKVDVKEFVRELALDTKTLISFLKESQPSEWKKLSSIHGVDVESKFLQRLTKELDNRGMLDVLRHGVIDFGVRFKLAFFKPVSGLNPESERFYNLNKLTLTRQVKYSLKNENSIDMLLSLNGLPLGAIELKNQFTAQNVANAKRQFIEDRDPTELIFQFKKRALVFFAVDTDEVYLTTKLEGGKTRYLPFNLGHKNGAGNPPNSNGYKTSYLWEYVLQKDSFMDIIQRFMHVQIDEYSIEGRKFKKETMLFPRYHQLDVVRKLEKDVKEKGAGKNYLVEHSAGSGKSNSIAWLAYRLSSLHDKNDKAVFDSVIVITDRLVLDQQLQNTIYQFEHKSGVVKKIEKNSDQLAEALSSGTRLIITTLQKFPYVLDKIGSLPKRKYALIIDEAHSSQGGESTKKMKQVLSYKDLEEAVKTDAKEPDEDNEDEIRKTLAARGPHNNLSFFGFTATPKARTLEYFGVKDKEGSPKPFHLYSMRQAIEEGFILDVLKNYTTYATFFKLSKEIEDDPKMNKKKAKRAIARFVALHPHNLAQKTEVMVEHFRQVTMKKIGGKAKAMVITPSRLHVVKYYQEFKRYLKEKKYSDIKALVAFSGKVKDDLGLEYTEPEINKFGEKELPEKFNTSEYQILLVADKYQTGYDQPLLHTMYVDKRLSGIKAVQTLSRLNRTCPGKEDTFILDFVNDTNEIVASFQPYYEETTLSESTDPNKLYDLKAKLEQTGIIEKPDVDNFCKIFFRPGNYQTVKDHAQLNAFIDTAVNRYLQLPSDETKEYFKHNLIIFSRLYAFLSQIIPFQDTDLEKFYAYSRLLSSKLPKQNVAERFALHDEVALEYYRLQKITEGSLALEKGKEGALKPLKEAGTKKDKEEFAKLSQIINVLNEKFGTDFTPADQLFFDQMEEELATDEHLSKQAKTNTMENFQYGFDDAFLNKLIDRMDQNQDIFKKIIDDEKFAKVVREFMLKKVYARINKNEGKK
ncbi:MAG TPA: DEAD/DEAH box helicase family protein [archaeon]|nr:DEAD/DEAH box helicase family protein [archaeon]